mgnify:CR=1 FL=1
MGNLAILQEDIRNYNYRGDIEEIEFWSKLAYEYSFIMCNDWEYELRQNYVIDFLKSYYEEIDENRVRFILEGYTPSVITSNSIVLEYERLSEEQLSMLSTVILNYMKGIEGID